MTQDEIREEVIALQDMGHKRLAIETGEDPVNNPIEYVLESLKTIYSVHHKNGAIRRANVNIAATTIENYRKLKRQESELIFFSKKHITKNLMKHFTQQVQNTTMHTIQKLWIEQWRVELMM